ncbi:hypothetical protein LINPERPRIM_LOCUS18740 [Linum perenne]
MDPCPFVRILVGNLALKFPAASDALESSSTCLAKIKFKGFSTQLATIPILLEQDDLRRRHLHHHHRHRNSSTLQSSSSSASAASSSSNPNPTSCNSLAACFNLDKNQIDDFVHSKKKSSSLNIEVFAGEDAEGATPSSSSSASSVACCFSRRKLIGTVVVPLDLLKAEFRPAVMHNGWVPIAGRKKGAEPAQFFLNVRVEPDPRYVFQFESDPVCSPQVFQVQGNVKQAVFTCKFNLRNQGDRSLVSRQSMSGSSTPRRFLACGGGGGGGGNETKDQFTKERKGWTITIHDLSGSPVAMASMVTPFVPSPGSDRVSRSNPGAWLILRPSSGTWKSWGRLEAWREGRKHLGYRFDLLHDGITATPTTSTLVNSVVNTKGRGKFNIDMTAAGATPVCSPHSSCDFGSGSGSWSGSEFGLGMLTQPIYKGFVMSSTVDGKGGQPEVELGIQHVNCTEDAAAFVALAAAVDLSREACRVFPRKLRKGLSL